MQHGGSLYNVNQKDIRIAKIAGVPLNTTVMDRYAYALNNPVMYNDPTGYDSCGGLPGFSYCYYLDDTFVILEWQGQYLQFNLTDYDPQNKDDLKVLQAIKAYILAADNYAESAETLPGDFGVAVFGAIITLVAWRPVRCIGVGV